MTIQILPSASAIRPTVHLDPAIIDVLLQCSSFAARTATISHEAHYLNKQGDGAARRAFLGIKDVGLAKSQAERLRSRGIFAEKVSQVRGWLERCCQRQQR